MRLFSNRLSFSGPGTGDVVGPSSSTDNAVVRFDGTTGKLIQNSLAILSDSGDLSGLNSLTISSGAAAGYAYFTNTATGAAPSNGLIVGVDASGNGIINQQEDLPIKFIRNGNYTVGINKSTGGLVDNSNNVLFVGDPTGNAIQTNFKSSALVFGVSQDYTGIDTLLAIGSANK